MNIRIAFGLALAGLWIVGCSSKDEGLVDGFTAAERDQMHKLSPLGPIPPDTTNKYADSPMAATLGQRLFFERRFAGPLITGNNGTNGGLGMVGQPNKVACSDCHNPKNWYIDDRSNPPQTSLGVDFDPARHSPSLVDAMYYKWIENDGYGDELWTDGMFAVELPYVMGGTRLKVAHAMYALYKNDYNAIFQPPLDPALDPAAPNAARFPPDGMPKADPTQPDGPWEKMAPADQLIVSRIFVNMGKAIGAYLRLLVSGNAPFDKYVAGDLSAISPQAKSGIHLFLGKGGCVSCHNQPHFSDDKFHNNGWTPDPNQAHTTFEDGRYSAEGAVLHGEFNSNSQFSDDQNTGRLNGVVQQDSDKGKWRTKGLRNVAQRNRFFHSGQFATMLDVIKFDNLAGAQTQCGPTVMQCMPGQYIGTKDALFKPLNLTDSEMNDIVEFLKTLTGDPIPAALQVNTAAP